MRYKCLLIDHDDTSVDSTPYIHYPAHQEQMRQLGRDKEILDLSDWFRVNYHPGIRPYLQEILKLSPQEQDTCYRIWREFTIKEDPPFFPGFLDLMKRFTDQGGRIFVISHSEADIIKGHYLRQKDIPGFMPHEIYGWTGDPLKTKPHTWPVDQIRTKYGYSPREMLMIDDLKPGIQMAQKAGIDSIGAGWSHQIAEIQQDLAQESTCFCDSLDKAAQWIFRL